MELLKTVKDEWAVISTTPFTFLTLAVVMFAAAYFIARWRYAAVIEQLNASKDALTERLHLRSEQTESFRDKASKFDEKLAEVVDSGSPELKERTLRMVADIREFIGRSERLDQATQASDWHEMNQASSDEEKRRMFEKYSNMTMRHSQERNGEYDRRFKVDSMMLRDELRSRLPNYKADEFRETLYERPTNYFGFNGVADDLERMAKSL